jgi:hypothetical protein
VSSGLLIHERPGRFGGSGGFRTNRSPREQLDMAINAVFDSWNTERARLYRRRERIPHLTVDISLSNRLEAEMGEDFSLRLGDFGREGLGGAVDDDGGAAPRSELLDGQGGEHDGQVRLDGLPYAVEHGPGIEIGLRHA